MRKLIKPAHPSAKILDPERSTFIPADGIESDWTPYWIGLEARGDIIASDIVAAKAPAPADDRPAPTIKAPA